jgi:hypothetical protein
MRFSSFHGASSREKSRWISRFTSVDLPTFADPRIYTSCDRSFDSSRSVPSSVCSPHPAIVCVCVCVCVCVYVIEIYISIQKKERRGGSGEGVHLRER